LLLEVNNSRLRLSSSPFRIGAPFRRKRLDRTRYN
jgi:hypothetical protein